MIRRPATVLLAALLGIAAPAAAQTELTLAEAIARARSQNLDVRSAAAAEREAAARVTQARAGYLPKVDVAESWQRGNQPVFVFSSLLAQRQFTVENFAVDALNHPDALDNFRASLSVEQSLFDGATGANVRAAQIGQDLAAAERSIVDHDLAVRVTDAYGRVLVAAATRRSAAAAVEAAESDRQRAINRRDAGMVTEADVLELDVHLARTRERQIRADADERIARARLNDAIGEPLDAIFTLDPAPTPEALTVTDVTALEPEALRLRPDVRSASLRQRLAETTAEMARAKFLPQLSVQGGWELNGPRVNAGAASWVVGAVARINVFNGLADKARLAQAREEATRSALEREKAETTARLDLRVALSRVDQARSSEVVGRAMAEQAREARRIIRDRYEAGMADVASLLRAADAVLQAETQQIAAEVDVLMAAAALRRALGRP